MCVLFTCEFENRISRALFSIRCRRQTLYNRKINGMKNDVPKTVLLSFVTNFLGGNPFLLYLCSTAAACTRYRFQSPLPFRKNTFDYHLLLTNSIPHFSRPFLSFVEKCPHINSLRTCVLDDIYLLEKNVYTLCIFFLTQIYTVHMNSMLHITSNSPPLFFY